MNMVRFDFRRLVVEAIAAGILAVGFSFGVKIATDLSGRPLNIIIALVAVFTVKAASWLWDAKTKKN